MTSIYKIMSKINKWQRSDIISGIALLFAIPALIFSSIEFFEKRNETISIEKLNSNEKYWHVSEITKTRQNLYVSEILEWQRIRISNKSNFPVTIINSYFKIDDKLTKSSLKPFFEKVKYTNNKVELINPIEMPMKIEAQTVKEFYFPIQIPIDSSMGMALLLTSFNAENLSKKSSMAPLIFNQNYFDEFIDIFNSQMDSSELKRKLGVDIAITSFDKITVSRNMINEIKGKYEFIDEENKASDGFVFLEKSNCLYKLNEILIKYDKPIQTTFTEIEVCFRTLKNNEYCFEYLNTDFWK